MVGEWDRRSFLRGVGAASEKSTDTNSNFRPPFVNLDAMVPPGELSKSNMEVRHDSQ